MCFMNGKGRQTGKKLMVTVGAASIGALAVFGGLIGEARAQTINHDSVISTPGLSTSPGDSSSTLDHVRKPTEPPAFDPKTPPAVDPSKIQVSNVVAPPSTAASSDVRGDVGDQATKQASKT